MSDETAPTESSRPWLWAVAFVLGMFGAAAVSIYELLGEPWRSILALAALSLLVPMVRASWRQHEQKGCMSPALRRYNRRVLLAGAIYMVSFWVAAGLYDSLQPASAAMWAAALVPAVPAVGMIWAMQRYLVEESDEYLRHRAVQAALFGLGLVLVLGTVWGFLETFGLAPHVWSWWVFPVWAIGMGIGHCWLWMRGR